MERRSSLPRSVAATIAAALFAGVLAQPPTPALREGRFVYQLPNGYLPPRVSQPMVEELQQKAASQKYPFYVVLMDRVANDQEASSIGNRFLDDWAKNAKFSPQRSSLFLVTFTGDRKYRLFPAPEWRSRLGLEKNERGDALTQFTAVFLRSAKAGNPMEGISNLMSEYNAYIFDRTDPKRVAQLEKARREEAERQRIYEEERARIERLQNSQQSLNAGISRLDGLLAEKSYLPPDVSSYEEALRTARMARDRNIPEEMDQESRNLGQLVGSLAMEISKRQTEERRKQDTQRLLILATVLGLGGLIAAGAKRRAAYLRDKCQLAVDIEAWKAKISGARLRYYDKVYSKENDLLSQRLKQYAYDSETGKLFQSTVQETDSIISQVEALAIHVEECERLAATATFLNLSPLRSAATKLNESFEFDTNQISSKLMDPISTTIKVNPHVEEENLNLRFEQAIHCWNRLRVALSNSNIPASQLFKHDDLNAMIAKAQAAGIPLRWLRSHPLFGDESADMALYTQLDGPRTSDPILYCREVEKNLAVQTQLESNLSRLIGAVQLAGSEEVADLSGLEGTVLGPDDDPKITLGRARQNQDRLAGFLESSDSIDEIEQQANKVHGLYAACRAQIGEAKNAIATAFQAAEKAKETLANLESRQAKVEADLRQAANEYANVEAASNALEAAMRHLDAGRNSLEQSKAELSNRCHLASLRLADAALDQFDRCSDRFDAVYRTIADLEQLKRQYEMKLNQMEQAHEDAIGKICRYNGHRDRVSEYRRPSAGNGPADYALLMGMLVAQEQNWNAEVLNAKREYDYEIARQLELERQRREEEAERNRQSSFSSSSWGSSSSSSSSSDSGGSWSSSSGDSGGSFSSGGGDSGGSW